MATEQPTLTALGSLAGVERIAERDRLLREGRSLIDGRRLRFRFPAPAYDPHPCSRQPVLPAHADPLATVEPADRLQPRSIRPLPIRVKLDLTPAPAPAPVDPRYRLRPVEVEPITHADVLACLYDRPPRPVEPHEPFQAGGWHSGCPARDFRCYRLNPDGSRTLLTRAGRVSRRSPGPVETSVEAIIGSLGLPMPTQADFD